MKRLFSPLLFLLGVMLHPSLVFSAPVLPPLNSPATDVHIPGKFVWFELAAVDVEKQKQFYGEVFGWKFRTINPQDDQYSIIVNGDRPIAGLFAIKPREDVKLGALWIGLMSVDNPKNAVSITKGAGGTVNSELATVPLRGTFALLRDPEGAVFGVLKSDSGDPPDRTINPGDFLWMDLFTKDMDRASKFYRELVGYEVETRETGRGTNRLLLFSANHYRAGIVPLPEDVTHSGWLPYIKVENLNAMLKKITDGGGHILVQPDKSLLNGNLAIFADPQGGVLGIVKWDKPSVSREGGAQ